MHYHLKGENLKMNFRLILACILTLSTIACSCKRPCQVPPVNQLQACLDIRRQLIFLGNNDPTLYPYQYTAGNWILPTRQALLLRKYREFNCDAVLRECSPPAVFRPRIGDCPAHGLEPVH